MRKKTFPLVVPLTVALAFTVCMLECQAPPTKHILTPFYRAFYPRSNVAPAVLAKQLSPITHAVWATGSHTAAPVPLGCIGPKKYTKQLKGIIHNSRIGQVLKQAVNDNVNVILVIGDGMGVMHMAMPMYANTAFRNGKTTVLEKIANKGELALCLTNSYEEIVGGSAGSGTAIACGVYSRHGMLGLDHNGNPVLSVLDIAESNGMVTGLVTDTRLTHATPAAFYVKSVNRNSENEIAAFLVDSTDVEVLMGGGAAYFIPESTSVRSHDLLHGISPVLSTMSARSDKRDLLQVARQKGYTIVGNEIELLTSTSSTSKLLGLFAGSGMNARVDRLHDNTGEPSLPVMAKAAVSVLESHPKGFFLMFECGRIDWESHRNDAGAVMHAMMEMDAVLAVFYKYYKRNFNNTLLVFTSDHETSGLGICYSRINLPPEKKLTNGKIWKPLINAVSFDTYRKLLQQERTLKAMIDDCESPKELTRQIRRHTPYWISREQAADVLLWK